MTRPTLRRAVPDTFLDAPDYNWNFDQLLDYVEEIETSVSDIESEISGATVGIGTVIWFAKDTAPTGYLPCNGAAVSRTDYADLFAKINTAFGTGDGSTTFNLPNLIGKVAYGSTTMNTGDIGDDTYSHSSDTVTPNPDEEGYLMTGEESKVHTHKASDVFPGSDDRTTNGQNRRHKHRVPACGLLPCIKY